MINLMKQRAEKSQGIRKQKKQTIDSIKPPIDNTNNQQQMSQLIRLLTNFVIQTASNQKEMANSPSNIKFQIEPRDKQVLLPLPPLPKENGQKILQKQLKLWIANVNKTVFSSAFYYYSKGQMSFEQTKIYCTQNILKNLAKLNEKYSLNSLEFQAIDKHLIKKVLPYLGTKYPLTDSTQINKKLSSLVQEIDNIEQLQNNYFTKSKIGFEYRKQGHYYDIIMKVINDLLNKIDSISQNGKTNFQDFQKFMTKIFQKVYDSEWMNRNEDISSVFLNECLKYISPEVTQEQQKQQIPDGLDFLKVLQEPVIRKQHSSRHQDQSYIRRQGGEKKEWGKDREVEREQRKEERKKKQEQEKYKIDVKEYTSFLIGRKIPQNVPLFNEEEINQNKISVKHPAVLRILTKWFEQLWKKFEKNYFINRSESIKLQKGENVLDLKPEYRKIIDKLMTDEKKKITNYIKNIQKLNYKLEANILKLQQNYEGQNEMEELERICGKFSYKIVKALHNEIVQYLNKVIHSILTVSKQFHQYIMDPKKHNQSQKSNWPFPPNLISFKLGDLMRCKFSSKQKEIIKIYNQMIAISHSKQYGQKFKIVRIKNRLKDSTNDILINIRFNNEILCEIQLAIKSHASDFIKRSNAFHHYIYQLERSQFGPLSELCSIWMSLDNRAKIYQNLVTNEVKKTQTQVKKSSCRCEQYMTEIEREQPFICDQCSDIYLHNSYILNHIKCRNCSDYFVCAKCRIFKQDFQILKSTLILQKKIEKDNTINNRKILRDNCMRLINRNWNQFQNEKIRYGLSIFIQSQKIRLKTFKLVLYNSKKYLLGKKQNGQFYEIGDISDQYFLREFKKQNILIQIKENEDILKIDDLRAIKEYILPKIAKQNYRKCKQSIVLHIKTHDYNEKKLSNKDCSTILLTGQKTQRQKLKNIFVSDNEITQLPCKYQDFPNIQWLVLSRNPIESLQGLEKFNQLKTFVLENNGYKFHRNIPKILTYFINLEYIEKIVLSNLTIQSIPSQFNNLRRLKCLQLQNCNLNSVENICLCLSLQKLNISNNKISHIPSGLKNLKKLETLILHHNPIELTSQQISLPQSTEKKEVCIVNLDLSYCNIKELTFKYSSFANLQTLNLESNSIQKLQHDIFLSMGRLKLLNLSCNLLEEIPNFTCCSKLSKVYISNNKIEELPEFLSKLPMDEFKFQGCPIRRIDCLEWLKNMLNENSSILQKYLYWFQRIPFMDYIGFNSKYITKYLDSDIMEDVNSQSQQDADFPFDLVRENSLLKSKQDYFDEKEANSESQQDIQTQSQLKRFKKNGSSQSQMNYSSFFHPLKRRLSLLSDDASSNQENDSQKSQEQQYGFQQFQYLQGQLRLSDNKCTENLTLETIKKYFQENDMFVFDFQSKIKYFLETTLYYREFNLYHDENKPEVALKFQKMIIYQGYTNSRLNIYTGKFTQNIEKDLQKRRRSSMKKHQIFYNDLRKDKIPFTYAITLPNQKSIQIRNTQLRELPVHLLSKNHQKVIIYKIKSLPQEIQQCFNLKSLKVRRSQLISLPQSIGLLRKLQRLDLNKNMIQTIDRTIFLELKELKVLILSENKLKQMPNVYNCINLQRFYISDNNLQIIPKEITVLLNLRIFQFNNCPVKVIECGEWLLRLVDKDEAVIHDSQLCLWKMHYNNRLKYQSNYIVHKLFKWSQKVKQEYQPYNVADDNKHQLFFQQNFREQQIFNRFSNEQFLVFRFTNRTKFEQNKISYYKEFKVIVDKKQPNTLPKFKQFLSFYGLANTKLSIEEIDFIDFPTIQSPSCFKCHEQLSYPFYWLKWQSPNPQEWIYWAQKPSFACRNCIQSKPEEPNSFYRYERNSILLLQKLDVHKMPSENIGKNIQPQSIQLASRHSFECKSCKKKQFQLGEPRYLCLSCIKSRTDDKTTELLDICSSCMQKVINKDEKISKKLLSNNHRVWHPFLRILFNTKGYYNY